MELINAIKARRSIRKFKADPVPDNLIREVLEAAKTAPSGTNIQPWRFVVVKSEAAKERLSKATTLPFVTSAPVVIACCVDNSVFSNVENRVRELKEAGAFLGTPLEGIDPKDYVKRRNADEATAKAYLSLNAAIAIDHLTLRAVDLGLGTCWVMMFDQNKAKEAMDLDERYTIIALIPIGYPDQDPPPRPRLPLEEVVLKEI